MHVERLLSDFPELERQLSIIQSVIDDQRERTVEEIQEALHAAFTLGWRLSNRQAVLIGREDLTESAAGIRYQQNLDMLREYLLHLFGKGPNPVETNGATKTAKTK